MIELKRMKELEEVVKIEILKKKRWNYLLEISAPYQIIRNQSKAKNLSISTLCRVLKVNWASYYRWLSPTKSKRSIEDDRK